MADNTLKTRIVLNNKMQSEWESSTYSSFVPLKGEICIYSDLKKIKIGDGTSTIGNLTFANLTPEEVQSLIQAATHTHSNKSVLDATTSSFTTELLTKLNGISDSADAVSFTRSLNSGTKVGTITINGTGTDLYAPTNTDTHYTTGLKVGASATATANASATNGNVYLNVLDNTTVRDSHKIVGSGATSVTSDENGVITISSTDTKITVDSSLSSTSTNPVQNKVVNSALSGKVPTTRTVNGKALSSNITLTASDVGADASGAASSALADAKSYSDANLATAKGYADTKIANLVGTAPETMDTLEELAAAIDAHQDVTDALNAAIGNKANSSDLTAHTGNTTVHITAAERTKWNSAEVNQNAFSNITVGDTTVVADSKTDTLTLEAGSNVTLTPDATTDKITITAKDTTYSNFVKSGTGAKAGLVPAPSKTAGTTKYLREDGTWAVPPDTNTDTKVTNTLETTTKAYVTGTTSATTNTGTQIFDTGIYLDTVAGQLVATTFKGALTGNVTGNVSGSSGSCTGNSATASKAAQLTTARTIALSGGVTGTATSFNGTANISIPVTSVNAAKLTLASSDTLILDGSI